MNQNKDLVLSIVAEHRVHHQDYWKAKVAEMPEWPYGAVIVANPIYGILIHYCSDCKEQGTPPELEAATKSEETLKRTVDALEKRCLASGNMSTIFAVRESLSFDCEDDAFLPASMKADILDDYRSGVPIMYLDFPEGVTAKPMLDVFEYRPRTQRIIQHTHDYDLENLPLERESEGTFSQLSLITEDYNPETETDTGSAIPYGWLGTAAKGWTLH